MEKQSNENKTLNRISDILFGKKINEIDSNLDNIEKESQTSISELATSITNQFAKLEDKLEAIEKENQTSINELTTSITNQFAEFSTIIENKTNEIEANIEKYKKENEEAQLIINSKIKTTKEEIANVSKQFHERVVEAVEELTILIDQLKNQHDIDVKSLEEEIKNRFFEIEDKKINKANLSDIFGHLSKSVTT